MRERRPNARLGHCADDVRCDGQGKVTITLARAASFQRAGEVGQLAAIRFAGSAVSSSFEEALTDVVVAGLRPIAEARRSRTG
jgi:hypothetical protein